MTKGANTDHLLTEARALCRPNLVKKTVQSNKLATSFGLRLCYSPEIPLIARHAGYSAILMNLEHTAVGIETVRDISIACLNVGITPMVVVPTCEPQWISRCLDAGVQAVIVPHVGTEEEAKMCVDASKYPPLVSQECDPSFFIAALTRQRDVVP